MNWLPLLLIIFGFVGLFTHTVETNRAPASDVQRMGLFPEDGTGNVRAWYWNPQAIENQSIIETLKPVSDRHQFQLQNIAFDYTYIQDMALFRADGTFLVQANLGSEPFGLTRGVFNDEDGFVKITKQHARDVLKLQAYDMNYTVVEGGELISGRFANGDPYVILAESVKARAKAISGESDEKKVVEWIAKDLHTPPQHLFFVPGLQHLDLYMQALPGGKLLLHDHQLVLPWIESVLRESNIEVRQRQRLERIRKFYREGLQHYYLKAAAGGMGGKPIGEPLRAYSKEEADFLDKVAVLLSKHFEVKRVAGIVREPYITGNPMYDYNPQIVEHINFFNAFSGRDPQGRAFVVSNSSRGLNVLEESWRRTLSSYQISPENIHFVGFYTKGAGIDCLGASR